jgi:hypothetical protein
MHYDVLRKENIHTARREYSTSFPVPGSAPGTRIAGTLSDFAMDRHSAGILFPPVFAIVNGKGRIFSLFVLYCVKV